MWLRSQVTTPSSALPLTLAALFLAPPAHAHSIGFLRTSINLFSRVPSNVPTSGSYSHRDVNGTTNRRGRHQQDERDRTKTRNNSQLIRMLSVLGSFIANPNLVPRS
jgi:hypothetical protein